jgi:hypothetical protein
MTGRERLPTRRESLTECVRWPLEDGRKIHVTAGFSPSDGRVLEAFLRGGGVVGSERDHLLDDVAVPLSRLLQHGDQLDAIAAGLGRLPSDAAASLVGAVVDKLAEIEREAAQ